MLTLLVCFTRARCVSGSLRQDSTSSCSNNLANRKVEASNDPQALIGVACTERSTLNKRSGEAEDSSKVHSNDVFVPSELNKHLHIGGNSQTCESNVFNEVTVLKHPSIVLSNCETTLAAFMGSDHDMVAPSVSESFPELSRSHCDFSTNKAVSNRDVQGLCSGLSSISISSHLEDSNFTPDSDRLLSTQNSINSSVGKHSEDNEYWNEQSTIPAFWEDIVVDDVLNIDQEPQNFSKSINNSPCLSQNVNKSTHQAEPQDQICHQSHLRRPSESFTEPLETGFVKHVESEDITGVDDKAASDMGENSIISDILSLELDAWEDSLVKLLDESDEPYTLFKAPTLRKVQNKNQSRFSFARQDHFTNDASDLQQSFGIIGHEPNGNYASGGLMGNKDMLTEKHPHVFPSGNSVQPDKFVGGQSFVPFID